MTDPAYTETPPDGIDSRPAFSAPMTGAELTALRRYQDAFYLAVYWPDPENFRACVKAWDHLLAAAKGGDDGSNKQLLT